MDRHPQLVPVAEPRNPDGVVVVLHGGANRKDRPMVSPAQLSVVRMVPIAKRIARAGGHRLAVYRLLNSTRGWDSSHTPVDDAHWALDELAQKFGAGMPAGLVGHSLGGRAAILGSTHPSVSSVVALNPWVYPQDGAADFSGCEFLIVHGDSDRIADPERSSSVAEGIARSANVGFVSVEGGKHAMLRRHRVFSGLAADFTATVLLDSAPSGTIADLRAGRAWITV